MRTQITFLSSCAFLQTYLVSKHAPYPNSMTYKYGPGLVDLICVARSVRCGNFADEPILELEFF